MTKRIFFFLLIFGPFYLLRLSQIPEDQIPEKVLVKVRGRVTQQPYLKGSKQIINVGPVLVITTRFPPYFYGQKLEISGKFEKRVINHFLNQYFAYYPAIRLLPMAEKTGFWLKFRQSLFQLRNGLENRVNRLFFEPQASLLNGILLGARKELPLAFWETLQKTGTLHVVVASGYNLTVVAGVLMSLLTLVIKRQKAIVFALAGMGVYALMVGLEPPVVRAFLMAGLALTAQALGRQSLAVITLFTSAMVMLLISPGLLFDLGFQLSFLATAGILFLEPLLQKKSFFKDHVFGRELGTTLAAQLGVTPVLLKNFGTISFLSPLINALVLPAVPLIMALGALSLILSLLWELLGQVMSWFTGVFLSYFVLVVKTFALLPWAAWEIESLSSWWLAGYYFILGFLVWRFQNHERGQNS